jgi:hypothetical protein
VVFVDEPGMKATKEANQEGTDAPPPRRSKRISQKQSKLPSDTEELRRIANRSGVITRYQTLARERIGAIKNFESLEPPEVDSG